MGKSRAVTRAWHKGTPYTVIVDTRFDPPLKRHFDPLEVERLQTFPDGWTSTLSKTQRLWTLGNAVTTRVIEHIAQCLKNYLDQSNKRQKIC